nr:phage tail protein [uncultured Schaedlerella sp.]
MYTVYVDGKILDYPGDEINCIQDSELKLLLNDAGSFEFDITDKNPEYGQLENRVSMIQVMKDDKEIFYGEVRQSGKESYNIKNVFAIGELAFLHDSIQPQAEYHDLTTRQILETWLNIHNSQVEERKRFYVGIVTIHDTNDSLYRYTNRESTLDAIREKLVDRLGGYLRIRKVDGVRYLDWITLPEYGKYCEQPIEFGTNLLDYAETCSAEDLATAVIPLGARLEESPIEGLEAYTDITSVNGGVDYLYIPEAVERYGWVKKVVTWDDVTVPANLKKKGEEWLKDHQYESMVLELTALDLSDLDNNYEAFALGDMVHASAWPYGMDRTFPVQEMTIYLQEPDRNRLTLGTTVRKNYTSQMKDSNNKVSTELDNVRQTTSWMQSAIDNATAMMTGSKGGYKLSEYDEDGRWLRDLYMNAPNKEDATHVMQINMNGIGFSRTGFEGPYLNAWTIDGVFLGEFIKAGTVTAEKLSVEYRESVNEEIVSKFNVAKDLISAEVTRAQGAEVELAASLKVTSELVETKVSKGDFGSYVQQYYDRVIYGFNHSSKYVQINPGEIAIYDNGVEDSKLRSSFDENGNHFYRDGYYIGKIGTNFQTSDRSKKGLVFDLENQAAYMTWAAKKTATSSAYTMVFAYTLDSIGDYDSDTLHAGCDLDMHNRWIRNAKISGSGIQYEDAGVNATINFVQVTGMNPDGTASQWGDSGRAQFKNGRLIDLNYYG